MQGNTIFKSLSLFFGGVVFVLTVLSLTKYTGQVYIYVLFSIIANLLLYFGFRKNSVFFDTFIGIFIWLGFWLKLTISVAFFDGVFNVAVGNFDGSGAAYDRALLVSCCGMLGFLTASLLREKLFGKYPATLGVLTQQGLFRFYRDYRQIVLLLFVVLFVTVALTNAYLGIYQRGSITKTTLPFGLNGIYKWLLLFGLASFSALILRFELAVKKSISLPVMFLGLLESFFSNVSLLSRGMILNAGALIYGVYASFKLYSVKSNPRFFVATLLILVMLMAGSVAVANYVRLLSGISEKTAEQLNVQGAATAYLKHSMKTSTVELFVDRWVGMEGVMAISSYPDLGWGLWKKAWRETYNEKDTSFYDNNLIKSPYANLDKTQHHHISLPGIIAFFFYPGSFWFLFLSMLVLGLMAAAIEACAFWLGGKNVILCSLIAQVVAYRYLSFGYVPAQSYLLFGTIFINLFIIYSADKVLLRFPGRSASS